MATFYRSKKLSHHSMKCRIEQLALDVTLNCLEIIVYLFINAMKLFHTSPFPHHTFQAQWARWAFSHGKKKAIKVPLPPQL